MTDHKKEALACIAALEDWGQNEGQTDATMLAIAIEANVKATLALVEQQRIANLIAYAMKISTKTMLPDLHPTDVTDFKTIIASIREGLNLS